MSDTSLGDSKTLVGQEEPGMFHYAQLIQERELVPVPIFAHDLAVPDLGEEDARHRRPSPGRWDGSPRDGGQPLGLGPARRPVCEDLIALGEDAVDVKAQVGEGRHEALVVSDALGFVQHRHARLFPCIVVRQLR
jgi:hypothetical protein